MNTVKTIGILSFIVPGLALANPNFHVGASTGIKQNGFKAGYGDNLFRKKQPIVNIFAGIEVKENLNLEIDLEKTINYHNKSTIGNDSVFLGQHVASSEVVNYESKAKFSSLGLSLNYKTNLGLFEKLNALFGVGLRKARVDLTTREIDDPYKNITRLTDDNSKNLIKLSIGGEYMFTPKFGMRGLLSWENSSKLQPKYANGSNYEAHLKNTLNYTLRLLVKF